jgi:tryptophan halogenase
MNKQFSIGIVGAGTAGLIAALTFRKAFPTSQITVIASSQIGIIGVGEGSTEHWRQFMDTCDIPLEEMIVNTEATHKYGIRYENWTEHTPDYFHSVSGVDDIYAHGLYATYMGFFEEEKLLTSQTGSVGLVRNQIGRRDMHRTVNQFHFDTNKLNDYLVSLCFNRSIKFIDDVVENVIVDPADGTIAAVKITDQKIEADFWVDATGFQRVLMTKLENTDWESYSPYLLCDSAIAFPTESDPNGKIRPYTRARAASNGWMWEIPTQERRGNGYVFSSHHATDDEIISEARKMSGYDFDTPAKSFKFDPGYLKNQWVKNCVVIGLASAFVEPLEASSIGSTILQTKLLVQNIASYTKGSNKMQIAYNKQMTETFRNILTMIRLHYISDRRDTHFWRDQAAMPLNTELQELIDLWSERPPSRYDSYNQMHLMFQSPHLAHVMQGQGLIPSEPGTIAINRLNIREEVRMVSDEIRNGRHNHELVDHREGLLSIRNLDREFP